MKTKEEENMRKALEIVDEQTAIIAKKLLEHHAQYPVKELSDFAAQSVREDRESRWISVETSPDSIASVLGLVKTINGKLYPVIVSYTKGHEIEYWDDDYKGEYDEVEDRNGTLYLKPGWYEECEQVNSEFDTYWIKREVILWQPLPSPPINQNNQS